jgi:membrane protein CcdC involved in cytochrome C biogenesis
MTKALVLLIVVLVVLAAAARPISQLIVVLTPLVLVIGALALAWQLVRYFTRR